MPAHLVFLTDLWPDGLLLAREAEDDGVEVKVGEEFLGAVRRVGEERGRHATHQHRDHRDQHPQVALKEGGSCFYDVRRREGVPKIKN